MIARRRLNHRAADNVRFAQAALKQQTDSTALIPPRYSPSTTPGPVFCRMCGFS